MSEARLSVAPIDSRETFKDKAYAGLRDVIVRWVPRRCVYVVRKTKQEVIEMITAWAALESMAARLITQHASDTDIAGLRRMFATFEGDRLHAKLDEYSEVNIAFPQAIIELSGNQV